MNMKTDFCGKWRIAMGGLLFLVIWAGAGCSSTRQVAIPEVEPQAAGNSMSAPKAVARPDRQADGFALQDDPDAESAKQTEARLTAISQEIAAKVHRQLNEKGISSQAVTVAVTAAVPLSDFKRETEFGRLLAEYLLTDLADQGLRVSELRLGKEIIILPQTGEFIMTRNPGELLNSTPAPDYVVVSTFTNTRSTLIVQGRLVGMQTGIVETSWRYTMGLNREILGLFYDQREVSYEPAQPFTMAIRGLGR